MMRRIANLWPYFLAATITFMVGLGVGPNRREHKRRRCFRFTESARPNTQRCPAPYYGMGAGDGVFDDYCFSVQAALAHAAADGDIAEIRALLAAGANPNSHAGETLQPLQLAAINGRTDAIRVLLDAGADVNLREKFRWTPLIIAADSGHLESVRLLLARGADVTLRGSDGSALQRAEEKHRPDVAEILRQAGATE